MNQYNDTRINSARSDASIGLRDLPSQQVNSVITAFFAVIDDSIVALFVLSITWPLHGPLFGSGKSMNRSVLCWPADRTIPPAVLTHGIGCSEMKKPDLFNLVHY